MNPERYLRIVDLFQIAVDLEPVARAEFLAEVCNTGDNLRRDVELMLAAEQQAGEFLNQFPLSVATGLLCAGPIERTHPSRIGHYRILGLLGEGGMGVVYEAEQDQPRRTVALKVVKPELANRGLLRRFEQESQALGRLQHRGIAQVYEAGRADDESGPQPYFAMELVRGDSLLKYAATHGLGTRQKLELMAQVCEAVHHAHQRGVIHRDLKPSNILVDKSGQPKILDFGVARVMDSDSQVTRQTDIGSVVGTLVYMSPEQLSEDATDLDIRSDVYALGVILFELLAGKLPYSMGPQFHDSVRTICEENPTPLGTVDRAYRGDIEIIVATALEKNRVRRYASAENMAADIWRHLGDEPIIARPPSAKYRLQKFSRRHKALMVALAALFIVLVGGIAASTSEAVHARQAEQVANAVNEFLRNDLLAQASPSIQAGPDVKPDRELKVRTVLDRAAARLPGKFVNQPLVEASIRQTIGNAYGDLGLYPDGQRQVERALDLRRRALGESHPDTLTSMHDLAVLYWEQNKYAEAEPLYAKALDGRRRVLGATHPDTLKSMHYLGIAYLDEGKYGQAETPFRKVLETRLHVLGESHPDTLMVKGDLATVYTAQGKYSEAEPLYLEALDGQYRVIGKEHPDTLITMHNLAMLYRDEGKYSKAEPLLENEVETRRRVLGEEHPYTVPAMGSLAKLYFLERKHNAAERLYVRILEIDRQTAAAEGVRGLHWLAINDLASVYFEQHRYQESAALLRQTLNDPRDMKTYGWLRYSYQSILGADLGAQKMYAEAERLLLSGYQGMLNQQASMPPWGRAFVKQGGIRLIQFYDRSGRSQQAAEWRKKLQLPDGPK